MTTLDGTSCYVELQIHHEGILHFNDNCDAHDHYDFFRSLLQSSYNSALGNSLESAFIFLDEVRGTPILLSLLTVIFMHYQPGDSLPADRLGLYQAALRSVVQAHLKRAPPIQLRLSVADTAETASLQQILTMMQSAAVYLRKQRLFSADEVEHTLRRCPSKLRTWQTLRQNSGELLPLLKMIESGGRDDPGSTTFQFRHLSLAEALAVDAMCDPHVECPRADNDLLLRRLLDDPSNLNLCRIGAGKLGSMLAHIRGRNRWDLSDTALSPTGVEALVCLLPRNADLCALNLDGSPVAAQAKDFTSALRHNTRLVKLHLSRALICDRAIAPQTALVELMSTLMEHPALVQLDLSYNRLDGECGEALSAGLRKNGALRQLNLLGNAFEDQIAQELADQRAASSRLQTLCGLNRCNPQAVVQLSQWKVEVSTADIIMLKDEVTQNTVARDAASHASMYELTANSNSPLKHLHEMGVPFRGAARRIHTSAYTRQHNSKHAATALQAHPSTTQQRGLMAASSSLPLLPSSNELRMNHARSSSSASRMRLLPGIQDK